MEISFFAHEIFQFASSVIPNLATLWLSKLRPFWSPWRGEKKVVTMRYPSTCKSNLEVFKGEPSRVSSVGFLTLGDALSLAGID